MKKLYSFAMALSMLAASAVSASAEGIHLGYCDGKLPATGMSYGSANQTISAAICLTPEQLAPYADCQVTSLYVGIPNNAADLPATVTGWLRTQKDGENITSTTVDIQKGWLTLTFDAPVNIADYAEAQLWAGFEYTQGSKASRLLAFGGQTGIPEASWVAKNGKWTNFKNQGVLPIEVIVEGESLPQHDLTLLSCQPSMTTIKLGTSVKVNGQIKNNALVSAVNPLVKVSFDDQVFTQQLNAEIGYRGVCNFSVTMPLDPEDMTERETELRVEVLWDGDIADDIASDNVATFPISLVKDVYFRKMVVEEATGAWCPWCVRGIVGLREMRAKYPDQFIGLAVHDGDAYVVSAYDQWIGTQIDGYPSCLINRDGHDYDPNFAGLENFLLQMPATTNVGVDLTASYANGTLTVNATVNTLLTLNVNYRLAFVVVEDQLPISQANNYSGGGNGPMGGFESMPNPCSVNVDDVVRAIFPSPTGEANSVPSTLTKGEPYTFTKEYSMCNYSNAEKVSVVALLINSSDKTIVNAAKTEQILGLNYTEPSGDGIEQVAGDAAASQCFDLRGQRLSAPQQGFNVIGGRVVFMAR